MLIKIYFHHNLLTLSDDITDLVASEDLIILKELSQEKLSGLLHQLEAGTAVRVLVDTADPLAVLEQIKASYTFLQAAGGFVYRPSGELLLIYRRGYWDLPKGKREEGEDMEACALREISEETGLHELKSEGPLSQTYHTYQQWGQSVLKETHWYLVLSTGNETPVPQTEEDIEACRWVMREEV